MLRKFDISLAGKSNFHLAFRHFLEIWKTLFPRPRPHMYHNAWGSHPNPRLSIQQVTVPTAVNSKQYTVQYSTFDARDERLPPPPPAGAASDRGKGGGRGTKGGGGGGGGGVSCLEIVNLPPPFSAGAEGGQMRAAISPEKRGRKRKGEKEPSSSSDDGERKKRWYRPLPSLPPYKITYIYSSSLLLLPIHSACALQLPNMHRDAHRVKTASGIYASMPFLILVRTESLSSLRLLKYIKSVTRAERMNWREGKFRRIYPLPPRVC